SATVLNTGSSRWVVPPLPGVTPPTTWVPYSIIWVAWKVPCWPVKPCTITLVFLLIKTLMGNSLGCRGSGSRLHSIDDLLGTVVDVVCRDDGHAAVTQQLLAFFHVGAFQAHHDRDLDAHFLDRGDDALGDHVAADDAAEDVDEDALDLVRGQDQLEGLDHALLVRAAADVEEVRRLAAVELDHVHGGHGQAGAVDHAADVAVHGHVVDVQLRGGHLGLVFLRLVTQGDQFLVAEVGVVVAVELAVQRVQVAVVQDRQRVQLDQRQVLLVEQAVQVHHDVGELAGLLGGQPHLEADVTAVVTLHALDEVDVEGVDLLGGLGGDLLDLHAALARGDVADGAGTTVDQDRQVQLLDDLAGGGHQHQVDRQLDAGGLVGGHPGAEHLGGSGLHVIDG